MQINPSQRQRAWMFQQTGGKYAKTLAAVDGKTFTYGKTQLHFSEPVAHGSENSILGWVIMTVVEYADQRFMFAPDVQGPMAEATLNAVLEVEPTLIMLGGPPLYLEGARVEKSQIAHALRNLEQIVATVPVTIIEHHVLRDEAWMGKLKGVFEAASTAGHSILTAAEYAGEENLFLESRRKQLFQDAPPGEEFKLWMKTLNSQNIAKPPL